MLKCSKNSNNNNNVLVILPAFNVSETITCLLNKLKSYDYNFLFIDDGSSDNTYSLICESGFSCLQNNKNEGVSYSINKGILYAKKNGYTKIILMDADGQHSPSHLNQFIKTLNYADLVIGNRFDNKQNTPSCKLSSNYIASKIVESIWKIKISDITCGFKAFHLTDDIQNLFLKSSDYSIVFDLLFYSLNNSLSIKQVSVDSIYDYSKLLFTKRREILSFIHSLKINIHGNKLPIYIQTLSRQINQRLNFSIVIDNTEFYGFYFTEYDGYIIQTPQTQLVNY